jgi:proton-translocating NADH-quinone oxidoreductase chain M
VETYGWLILGVDGISILLILLTGLLFPICILIGWQSIRKFKTEYLIFLLVMQSMIILVFSVIDLLLFYIFFESVLIPMYLIIGIWGSREQKQMAAYQFFLYTLFGSLFMLLAIIWIYNRFHTTNYLLLVNEMSTLTTTQQLFLWLAFFASFATKVPMIPLHLWLPQAHVEAPTAGSVILAGILLKLGTYGMVRYSIGFFTDASIFFTPLVYTLSLIGIIYASLTTIRQIDLKRIIAYSSVAHMNFVTIGIFTYNIQGLVGAVLLMISHGLISSALFIAVGIIYDRFHTRLLPYYGGITSIMPIYSVLFIFFTFANISFPGTASFIGELLILLGIFQENVFVAIFATTGVVLGAVYSIWLANRLLFGSAVYNFVGIDITRKEMAIIAPLVFSTLFMGIYPDTFLQIVQCSCLYLINH